MVRAYILAALILSVSTTTATAADEKAVNATQPNPDDFPNTTAARRQVANAISECAGDMGCPTLKEFQSKHATAYQWLKAWCPVYQGGSPSKLSKQEDDSLKRMCAPPDGKLEKVSVFDLVNVSGLVYTPDCSGFGLTIPLYSVRYTDKGSVANGPVKAGLGGGYYWTPFQSLCKESFSAGLEVFAYSEGLDPSGLFQLGIAFGPQISAFNPPYSPSARSLVARA